MRDLQDLQGLINPEASRTAKSSPHCKARFYDYYKMMNRNSTATTSRSQHDLYETTQAIFEGELINKGHRRAVQESDDQPTACGTKSYALTLFIPMVHGQKNDTRIISGII